MRAGGLPEWSELEAAGSAGLQQLLRVLHELHAGDGKRLGVPKQEVEDHLVGMDPGAYRGSIWLHRRLTKAVDLGIVIDTPQSNRANEPHLFALAPAARTKYATHLRPVGPPR